MRVVLILAAGFCSACAGHQVSHSAPDESVPHISWEMRTGVADGDERLVCESGQTNPICVFAATTEQRPSRATIHLYLHSAATSVNYVGVLRLPFMQGLANKAFEEVSVTVPPGSRPVGKTIAGVVTPRSGAYEMTLALDGLVGDRGAPVRLAQQVRVTVQ